MRHVCTCRTRSTTTKHISVTLWLWIRWRCQQVGDPSDVFEMQRQFWTDQNISGNPPFWFPTSPNNPPRSKEWASSWRPAVHLSEHSERHICYPDSVRQSVSHPTVFRKNNCHPELIWAKSLGFPYSLNGSCNNRVSMKCLSKANELSFREHQQKYAVLSLRLGWPI